MNVLRRKFLRYAALFPLVLSKATASGEFPVLFTWQYPYPMGQDEAIELERKFLSYERLNRLNTQFIQRGWIKNIDIHRGRDHAQYLYRFDSYSAFLLWGFRKNSGELINYSKGRDLYKIVMSFPDTGNKRS